MAFEPIFECYFYSRRKSIVTLQYFEKDNSDLQMPREADSLGIEYRGGVLQGYRTVKQLLGWRRRLPANIDPVLRYHLREPEPRPRRW